MIGNVIETDRLILRKFVYDKNGKKLSDNNRKEEVLRFFKSWSNPQNYRYNEITWDIDDVNEMFDYKMPTDWGMYYMIAELKDTGEIVATCRFGQYYDDETNTVWDFGYNVFRGDDKESYSLEEIKKAFSNDGLIKDEKYWGKGYANEIINLIMKLAKNEGMKKLRSGADIDNFGSIKAMVKNGFTYSFIDEDGDPCMEYDLSKFGMEILKKKDIDTVWNEYLKIIDKERKKLQDKINDNFLDQYSSALAYYFLSLSAKGEKEKIILDLGKLSEDETNIMINKTNLLESRWKKRLANDISDERLKRHLEYCKELKQIFKKDFKNK